MSYADPDYFEALYRHDPDPWNFATSDYEREKYAATLAALPDRRFHRGFEIGCSIGVLTRQLAARCDTLLAIDIADTALTQARQRCTGLDTLTLERRSAPGEWPTGSFDLIVFSEVLYYLGIDGIREAARQSLACLASGGAVLLVNWHGDTGGACSGDAAVTHFIDAIAGRLPIVHQARTDLYRLDLLGGPPSSA